MANFSFDIVSDYDKSEINNVFEQCQREILSRYDFKNTPAAIEWSNGDRSGFKISGNSEMQIGAIEDMIRKKFATRGLDQKILDFSAEPSANNFKFSKDIKFKKGIDSLMAKNISSEIRNNFPKVKTQIQGDSLRVSDANKDELQKVISFVKSSSFDIALQFINYR